MNKRSMILKYDFSDKIYLKKLMEKNIYSFEI